MSAGAHKSTVKYSDSSDVTENNQDIMLGMEVGGTPGDIVIYIDSIQFHNVDGEGNLVDLPDSDGDQTALKTGAGREKGALRREQCGSGVYGEILCGVQNSL